MQFKKSKCNVLLPKKDWDELGLTQVMFPAIYPFPLARNPNGLFLPCPALCHTVVTLKICFPFEAHPQKLSHRRVLGSQSPGHLLCQSPNFGQVYVSAWGIIGKLPFAVAPWNFQEVTIPHCFWGRKSGRRIWIQIAGLTPCTCLLPSHLTP